MRYAGEGRSIASIRSMAAVFGDAFRRLVDGDTTYFALGKYDGGQREARLDLVKRELEGDRDGAVAFLTKDVPDAWECWPTKFAILASRATFVVQVLEDSNGSHHWETDTSTSRGTGRRSTS